MDFPRTVDEITPDWLTQVLRECGVIGDASVESYEIAKFDGGLAGQVNRLIPKYSRTAQGSPNSLVLKLSKPDADTRHMVDEPGLYRSEVGRRKTAI